MTPQEFRQLYVESQDRLGNDLQTISSLITELERVMHQAIADYEGMNGIVETFLSQFDSNSTDFNSEEPTDSESSPSTD